jgi:hypothetical protein
MLLQNLGGNANSFESAMRFSRTAGEGTYPSRIGNSGLCVLDGFPNNHRQSLKQSAGRS